MNSYRKTSNYLTTGPGRLSDGRNMLIVQRYDREFGSKLTTDVISTVHCKIGPTNVLVIFLEEMMMIILLGLRSPASFL